LILPRDRKLSEIQKALGRAKEIRQAKITKRQVKEKTKD